MVEAWASGLTWKEIMLDCAMDEGDLARLLRRTIDLLAQVHVLSNILTPLRIHFSTSSWFTLFYLFLGKSSGCFNFECKIQVLMNELSLSNLFWNLVGILLNAGAKVTRY